MQVFQLTKEALWYKSIRFSPDGRWLALNGKPFMLLDTTGQKPPAELPLGDFRNGFAFTRGGTAIAYLPEAQRLSEYNLVTRRVSEHKITDGYVTGLAADKDGETLYLIFHGLRGAPYMIRILRVRDRKV